MTQLLRLIAVLCPVASQCSTANFLKIENFRALVDTTKKQRQSTGKKKKTCTRIYPKYVKKLFLYLIYVHLCKCSDSECRKKVAGSPRTRATSSPELYDMGTRNQTQVLWKSSESSKMLNHLSNPIINFFYVYLIWGKGSVIYHGIHGVFKGLVGVSVSLLSCEFQD